MSKPTINQVFGAYRGNLDWLWGNTIFLTVHGSHAYGTATPASDIDVKGICIPPKRYILGFAERFEQADRGWQDLDCCIYSLQRWFHLAAQCNPNIIELLFVDESDWIFSTLTWENIVDHRDLFLSKAAEHRFSGYAASQLKRIHTHRRWLLNPPTHHPTRTEFGLPESNTIPKEQREALEALMLKTVENWQIDLACLDDPTRVAFMRAQAAALADMKLAADDQYIAAGNKLGLDSQAMELLKAERAYRAAMAEWTQYQTWLKERNPVRAELERKHGYDCKHAGHLVRLMRMAVEIGEGKGVVVRRPDAEELLSIRNGAWNFDTLLQWFKDMEQKVKEVYAKSSLPHHPDRAKLDKLCINAIELMLTSDDAEC